ncbi:hypothetical protein MKW98_003674, partial [Papaver atlanticum]
IKGLRSHSRSGIRDRGFSSSPPPPSPYTRKHLAMLGNRAAMDKTLETKEEKKKNLFEVAQFLPNWGIGYQMAKTHWSGVSYQITKINLYKDGKHGKAWGIVHKEGRPAADAPKKISGVHKRGWKYIPNSKVTEENSKVKEENIVKAAAEVQTA